MAKKRKKQKWYDKATVQSAISRAVVTGLFTIGAVFLAYWLNKPDDPAQVVEADDGIVKVDSPRADTAITPPPTRPNPNGNPLGSPVEQNDHNDEVDSPPVQGSPPATYQVKLFVPSDRIGASIFVDKEDATILKVAEDIITIEVPVKRTNYVIEVVKEGKKTCKLPIAIRADNEVLIPCQT